MVELAQRLGTSRNAEPQDLEKLESVLLRSSSIASAERLLFAPQQEEQRGGVQLLSIAQLCRELWGWARAGSTGACTVERYPA
jgi:hypothetical protein